MGWHWRATLAAAAFGLAIGCAAPPMWVAGEGPRPEDAEVVLGIRGGGMALVTDLLPDEIPEIPIRKALRPCCAFGAEIRAQLLGVPVPGFRIPNVLDVEDLGPHGYDSGVLPGRSEGRRSLAVDPERNGLVYTCRGGFIDTAHVRDYIDWGAYMASEISKAILEGERVVIPLPDEGGKRRVIVRTPAPETVAQVGPKRLAYGLSAWIAWNLSIWHEAATWYGWSSVPGFSEKVSAFSPEDLYSNALGARLLEVLMVRNGGESEPTFNRVTTRWIDASLRMLDPVPSETGLEAAAAVDGLWWDSSRRVPDDALVLRRNFDIQTPLVPWLVPPERAPEALRRACGEAEPFLISGAEDHPDIHYNDWVTLEIEPQPSFANQEPFPGLPQVINQSHLHRIVEAVRQQSLEEFGPGSDQP